MDLQFVQKGFSKVTITLHGLLYFYRYEYKVLKWIKNSKRTTDFDIFTFFTGGMGEFWVACNTPFLMLWSGMKYETRRLLSVN